MAEGSTDMCVSPGRYFIGGAEAGQRREPLGHDARVVDDAALRKAGEAPFSVLGADLERRERLLVLAGEQQQAAIDAVAPRQECLRVRHDAGALPPDGRARRNPGRKGIRLAEQGVQHEQPAEGVTEDCLAPTIHRCAAGDLRLQFLLDEGEEMVGAAVRTSGPPGVCGG